MKAKYIDYYPDIEMKNLMQAQFEEGVEIGREKVQTMVILNSYKAGLSLEMIATITRTTIEEVKAVLKKAGLL